MINLSEEYINILLDYNVTYNLKTDLYSCKHALDSKFFQKFIVDGKLTINFDYVETIYIRNIKLSSLENFPNKCFKLCIESTDLQSLEGCPDTDILKVNDCKLNSLLGMPEEVRILDVEMNNIASLAGMGKVTETLTINNNPIESFDYMKTDENCEIFANKVRIKSFKGIMSKNLTYSSLYEIPDVEERFLFNQFENYQGTEYFVGLCNYILDTDINDFKQLNFSEEELDIIRKSATGIKKFDL